jgi:hypothetical protein
MAQRQRIGGRGTLRQPIRSSDARKHRLAGKRLAFFHGAQAAFVVHENELHLEGRLFPRRSRQKTINP